MSFVAIIGGKRRDFSQLDYTNADPGGCETATVTLTGGQPPVVGDRVRIFAGGECVWSGVVEEPGTRGAVDGAINVGCVGGKAELSRKRFQMPYICQDLNEWRGPSRTRKYGLISGGFSASNEPSVSADETGGDPALALEFPYANDGAKPLCDAWLDAGPGNAIGSVLWTWQEKNTAFGDGAWHFKAWLTVADGDFPFGGTYRDVSFDTAASGSSQIVSDGQAYRYAMFEQFYSVESASFNLGDPQKTSGLYLTQVIALGDHALPLTADPAGLRGLRLSDVVADAVKRSGAAFERCVQTSQLVLTHDWERGPSTATRLIDRAAALSGWHWGVWPAGGAVADQDLFLFQPPPARPTAVVAYDDIEQRDLQEKFSTAYDTAVVRYSTVDGSAGSVTVTRPHPRVRQGAGQVLDIDAGVLGSAAAARVIGLYQLTLAQVASRAAGSLVLPASVARAGGGRLPSHLLRAGVDRIRVAGMPNPLGKLSSLDDSFRVARVAVSFRDGRVETSVEVDAGADLIEVLTARMQVAEQAATSF